MSVIVILNLDNYAKIPLKIKVTFGNADDRLRKNESVNIYCHS